MEVRQFMQRDVFSMREDDTLDVAADVMRLGGIRHIPVVSGDRLVGIVSQRDLLHAAASCLLDLAHDSRREWLGKIAVRDVMTTRVRTVAPDQPVADVVEAMLTHRVGCIPVVEDGRLVGIVSETDCLRYLARLLDIDATKHELPELPTGR